MELLVKAVDADGDGSFKAGDIVVARPDDWQWGTEEVRPPRDGGKFFVVKVPGIAVNRAHESQGANGRARRFALPLASLSSAVRDGVLTMPHAALNALLHDKDA